MDITKSGLEDSSAIVGYDEDMIEETTEYKALSAQAKIAGRHEKTQRAKGRHSGYQNSSCLPDHNRFGASKLWWRSSE